MSATEEAAREMEEMELRPLMLPPYDLQIRGEGGREQVFDPIRQKFVRLTPEEWVRQHFLRYLVKECRYPSALISVEAGFAYQNMQRRADIVVHDRMARPFLLVECKAPEVRLRQSTFDQVSRYNQIVRARYLATTNGLEHYCWVVDPAAGRHQFLEGLPSVDQIRTPVAPRAGDTP